MRSLTITELLKLGNRQAAASLSPYDKYCTLLEGFGAYVDKFGARLTLENIEAIAAQTEKKLLKSVELFDVYEGKNLPEGKKSYAVNFILQDESKTLNDKQIENVMNRLITNLKTKLGAELR